MNRTFIVAPLIAAALLAGCSSTDPEGGPVPGATITQSLDEVSDPVIAEDSTITAKVGEVIAVPVDDLTTSILVAEDPGIITVLGQGYQDGSIEKRALQAQANKAGTTKVQLLVNGKQTRTFTVTVTE